MSLLILACSALSDCFSAIGSARLLAFASLACCWSSCCFKYSCKEGSQLTAKDDWTGEPDRQTCS